MNKIAIVVAFSFPALAAAQNPAADIAMVSGITIGTARACGIDGNRLANASQQVFNEINRRAKKKAQAGDATVIFYDGIVLGEKRNISGAETCRKAEAAVRTIETSGW